MMDFKSPVTSSHLGEGFTAVLDTVESSLGAPDPEELVKQDMEARRMKEPDSTPNGQSEPQKGGLTGTKRELPVYINGWDKNAVSPVLVM